MQERFEEAGGTVLNLKRDETQGWARFSRPAQRRGEGWERASEGGGAKDWKRRTGQDPKGIRSAEQ